MNCSDSHNQLARSAFAGEASCGLSDEVDGDPPSSTPELSIICVNWNSLDLLLDCLESLYALPTGTTFETLVVDNASPEGGIEVVGERFPQVRIIKSPTNVGFAKANNLGFLNSSGRYVLLLNPDTLVLGSAIATMLDAIQSIGDAGIVGGMLLNTDLSVSTTSIQKFPTILNQVLTFEWLRVHFPNCPLWEIGPLFSATVGPVKVDVIPGACMMLKREVYERAGMLSEDYFMYAEDIDLNFRVRQLNLSSYYVGSAKIVHHGGRSSSKQGGSQWSTVRTCRAMMQLFRTHRGSMYARAYRAALGCTAAMRLIALAAIYPLGDRDGVRGSVAKWSTVLKWSLGIEQLGAGQ